MVYVAEIAETLTKPFVLVDMNDCRKGPFTDKRQLWNTEEYWYEVYAIDYDTEKAHFVLSV